MLSIDELNILLDTFLFRSCTSDEAESLLEHSSYRLTKFQKHQVLFTPESFRQELGIILDGRVRVEKGDGIVISELVPGSLFGAAALFNESEVYVSTLTARTDCRVLFLPQEDIRTMIDRSRTVRWNYITYLSERIRFLSDKVDALAADGSGKKLRSWLLNAMDDECTVTLSCSMTELASRLNIGRTSLYREFGRLESEEILKRSGRKISIIKPELLAQ